jgi:tRNA (adenine37-N6)-methyltransferase
MKLPELTVIGRVRSPVKEQSDEGWGQFLARIEMEEPYRAGLQGLEDFSHAVILTYLHQAGFDPAKHLVRRPRGLASMPELGIFAQRAKDRPNPIGLSVVEILAVQAGALLVRGLDAIDGTPVLDIKPYFPVFDRPREARAPAWVDELMQGYF